MMARGSWKVRLSRAHSQANHIVTIFAGQPVRPGSYAEPITHYSVLATIEAAYALPHDGQAAAATPITDIWRP